MNRFFKSLILIVAACLVISACSNPEEEAKKLGFSNAAEMKDIQSKGFKTLAEYKIDVQKNEEIEKNNLKKELLNVFMQCKSVFELQYQSYKQTNNPQAVTLFQLNETVKKLATDVGRELNINKSDIENKFASDFLIYEKPFLSSSIDQSVLDKHRFLLSDCNNKLTKDEKIKTLFNSKLDEVSKEIYNNETSGGLTRQQWQGRCSSYATSVNECAVSSNVSKCVETKMGVNDAYMAANYCNGSTPNWSLMGMKP